MGAFRGARAGCEALYSGPLVCRAGPAVKLVSIHGSIVPTEVVERQAGTQCDSSRAATLGWQGGKCEQTRLLNPDAPRGMCLWTIINNYDSHFL